MERENRKIEGPVRHLFAVRTPASLRHDREELQALFTIGRLARDSNIPIKKLTIIFECARRAGLSSAQAFQFTALHASGLPSQLHRQELAQLAGA